MYASGGEMSRRSIAKFNTNPISTHRPVAKPIEFTDIFTFDRTSKFVKCSEMFFNAMHINVFLAKMAFVQTIFLFFGINIYHI